MRRFALSLLWPSLVFTLPGCAQPGASVVCLDTAATGAFVRGLVEAPKGLTATGTMTSEEARAEIPVEAADVALADASGAPIPGLVHHRSDADGYFRVLKVPAGFAYMVVARAPAADGRELTFKALTTPTTATDTPVELSLASTLVTQAILEGKTGLVGAFDTASYAAAVAKVQERLATLETPPDPSNAAAGIALVGQWSQADSELATALERVRAGAGAPAATPQTLATEVAKTREAEPLDALSPIY